MYASIIHFLRELISFLPSFSGWGRKNAPIQIIPLEMKRKDFLYSFNYYEKRLQENKYQMKSIKWIFFFCGTFILCLLFFYTRILLRKQITDQIVVFCVYFHFCAPILFCPSEISYDCSRIEKIIIRLKWLWHHIGNQSSAKLINEPSKTEMFLMRQAFSATVSRES